MTVSPERMEIGPGDFSGGRLFPAEGLFSIKLSLDQLQLFVGFYVREGVHQRLLLSIGCILDTDLVYLLFWRLQYVSFY